MAFICLYVCYMYCQFDWQVLVTSLSLKLPEHYFVRHSHFSQRTNLTSIFVTLGLYNILQYRKYAYFYITPTE